MNVDVTVSIVNWNTKDELRGCLDSVLSQEGPASFEIIVIDNASSDGSAEMVSLEYEGRVCLIENQTNRGFGAAHNQSIELSNGRFVLLVNSDCRLLDADAISRMVRYMDANTDIGVLGPRVLNPDGSLQYSARRYPTMFAAIFRHTILSRLFPGNRFEREYMMTDWAHDEVRDVDWVSGSALIARRETFEQIGLLDERFYIYVEDVDWCRRAHEAGWRVVYFPMTVVSHRIGAASDQNPVQMIKQHHRSALRYFLKYEGRSAKVLLTPIVMLALWLRQRSLIRRARSGSKRRSSRT